MVAGCGRTRPDKKQATEKKRHTVKKKMAKLLELPTGTVGLAKEHRSAAKKTVQRRTHSRAAMRIAVLAAGIALASASWRKTKGSGALFAGVGFSSMKLVLFHVISWRGGTSTRLSSCDSRNLRAIGLQVPPLVWPPGKRRAQEGTEQSPRVVVDVLLVGRLHCSGQSSVANTRSETPNPRSFPTSWVPSHPSAASSASEEHGESPGRSPRTVAPSAAKSGTIRPTPPHTTHHHTTRDTHHTPKAACASCGCACPMPMSMTSSDGSDWLGNDEGLRKSGTS